MTAVTSRACVGYLLAGSISISFAGDPPIDSAPIQVELVRPEREWGKVVSWFGDDPARHPAAALAAWASRATWEERRGLGRWREVLAAACDPWLGESLGCLDGLHLEWRPADQAGLEHWHVTFPNDDGTLGALVSAWSLTEGSSEPLLGQALIDRLGPGPDALYAGRVASRVVVATSRAEVARGLASHRKLGPGRDSCARVQIRPRGVEPTAPREIQWLFRALAGLEVDELNGVAFLSARDLHVELTGAGVAIEGSPRRVERAWLERIRQDASLGWAIAWPSDPKACDRLFRVWDAVEKSDPKRAGAAAIRTRLDLTLAAIGMRPERDLWPRLRGISGWIATDPVGRPRRVVLSLHMVDEPAADRILEPLGRWSFPGLGVGEEPAVTDRSRIHVQREGATIDLIWGSSEVTRAPTGTSTPREEATLATMLVDQEPLPERFVWLRPRTWVAESLGVISAGALGTSDIIWTGYQEGDRSIERIRWREVDGVLKRTLEPPGGGAEDAAAVPVSR